jgi:D-alanyl-D-alanine carboxypeptidase
MTGKGNGWLGAGILASILLALAPTGTFSWVQPPIPEAAEAIPTQELRSRLQSVLDAFHEGGSLPGASAAVSLPDGSVIAVTTGEADTVRHIPMTPEARMLQGSVGKTYFAALALRLVGEGRLDLDARVSEYLGHLDWYRRVPNAGGITVRHLMTHTSGVMRYEFKPAFTSDLTAQPDKSWRPEELLSYVLDEAPSFAPGEGWEYSDTNFILLGMIMEEITGRPCYELIREEILDPLGLENTVPSDSRTIPGLIQGYAGPDNPFGGTDEVLLADGRFVINPQFEWAGGGFASTPSDLARWARALYTGKAFDSSLLSLMLEGVPAQLGPGSRYGLGVILTETPVGPSQGHSGFFPGYLTEMAYFPELDVAAALQVNTSVGRALGRSPNAVLVELARTAGGASSRMDPAAPGGSGPGGSRLSHATAAVHIGPHLLP